MSCEYARQYYNVPAEIGRRVTVSGKPGIIAEDRGHYIGVNFDDDEPGVVYNVHPASKVVYGNIGKIRKMTRAKRRYQDYINTDYCDSFAEYLGIYTKVERDYYSRPTRYRFYNRREKGPWKPTKKAAKEAWQSRG
jgi:hypothetical protein